MWELERKDAAWLTSEERQQVQALFACLIPANPQTEMPGAMELGAEVYLDRWLATDAPDDYEQRNARTLYRDGLATLNAFCRTQHQRELPELSEPERIGLLEKLEQGALPSLPAAFNQKQFFAVLLNDCIEGCFCREEHGGNRDGRMWKWFGYQYPNNSNHKP